MQGSISGELSGLSDAEVDLRIEFLSERLDAGQRNARLWQYSFTGAWSLGVAIGTTQAVLNKRSDKRLSGIVTAVKGVIGTTRLLFFPHPGRLGAEPIRAIEGGSRDRRLLQLQAGEQQLVRTEKYTHSRTGWQSHVFNAGLNLAGGAVILGLENATDAAISAGIGIVAGEILMWTTPWRSQQDLADYRQRIEPGLPSEPEVSWWLAPRPGGVSLEVRF